MPEPRKYLSRSAAVRAARDACRKALRSKSYQAYEGPDYEIHPDGAWWDYPDMRDRFSFRLRGPALQAAEHGLCECGQPNGSGCCPKCPPVAPFDLTALLALPVTDRPEAEAFIRGLIDLDLMYHFDDGAVDCLHGNGKVDEGEALAIDAKVDAVFAAFRNSGADMNLDDPFAYALNYEESK